MVRPEAWWVLIINWVGKYEDNNHTLEHCSWQNLPEILGCSFAVGSGSLTEAEIRVWLLWKSQQGGEWEEEDPEVQEGANF